MPPRPVTVTVTLSQLFTAPIANGVQVAPSQCRSGGSSGSSPTSPKTLQSVQETTAAKHQAANCSGIFNTPGMCALFFLSLISIGLLQCLALAAQSPPALASLQTGLVIADPPDRDLPVTCNFWGCTGSLGLSSLSGLQVYPYSLRNIQVSRRSGQGLGCNLGVCV